LKIEDCKRQIGSGLRLVGGFATFGCRSTPLEADFSQDFADLQFAIFNLIEAVREFDPVGNALCGVPQMDRCPKGTAQRPFSYSDFGLQFPGTLI